MRDMPFYEALELGQKPHREGRFQEAIRVYEAILRAAPGQPDVLNFLGVALHQTGRSEEGLRLLDESIAALPGEPGPLLNRANVLIEIGRLDEAAALYDQVIALGMTVSGVHNNLGVLHRARGQLGAAEQAYRTALELDPDNAETHNNLARLYHDRGQADDAIRHGCLALVSQPNHRGARKLIGMAYQMLGCLDDAVRTYREWLEVEPDNPLPRHLLSACGGEAVPARCADSYVEAEFDGFAASFDAKLADLSYMAPQLVAESVLRLCGAPQAGLDVLDAGCGTGLCGPLLAPYAKRLVGVDLSAGMLIRAEARGVYHHLERAELTAYIAAANEAYDLIVSADTLCYFGVLDAAVGAAAAALRPGGHLVFTVEASVQSDTADFHLQPHGRYSHHREYLLRVLAGADLAALGLHAVELRKEGGKPVHGWLVEASRGAGARATGQKETELP